MSVSRSAYLQAIAAVEASGVAVVQSALPSSDRSDLSRNELPLPLVIVAAQPASLTLRDTVEWIAAVQPHLESLLSMTGALYFRLFPTPSAASFGEFVAAFDGWLDLPYEDSLSYAVRLPVAPRVCTTNEGKRGGLIFHHELAQAPSPHYPSKLLFYCENEAESGGATAVSPSWRVLDELRTHYPAFVQSCRSAGVIYHTVFPAEPDTTKGVGRSWKSFWADDNKERVAARMSALGYTGRWDEQDRLHMDTPVLPAVRVLSDGTEVFFNQMIAQQLANAREFSDTAGLHGEAAQLEDAIRFGDGSPVDRTALQFAHSVSEQYAADMQWRKGDIALIDNMLCMHARREFEGPRRVFASLVQ